VGAEVFFAEKQTDMTQLTVTFCNFANATKKTDTPALNPTLSERNMSTK